MKKNLILLGMLCIMASCKAPQYTIGMDEQKFLSHNRVSIVEQTETLSVYKKVNYPFGAPAVTKFFYFRNGKLVQVDGGRQPDVIIDKTVHTN